MRCPRCANEAPPGAAFCSGCGTALSPAATVRCSGCGALLPERARFCPACGLPAGDMAHSLHRLLPPQYVDKLLASRGMVDGERRVVTILFSDVKGSTALAERLDPEEVLEIMNGAFEVLIGPITRYEGTLARLMGDAIMAFFGAPIAHEDDAARACHAALEIVEGIQAYALRLEKERGVKGFNVRVGLNTGLVVVAEVGSDLRVEYTAMGDAVNLAARMETAAEPGTVYLTEATLAHLGGAFETESIGALTLKGKAEPVKAHRLVRARVHAPSSGAHSAIHPELVGREAEIQDLREQIRDLRRGMGGMVGISGEIGIGKSRLVRDARIGFESLTWAETRSSQYAAGMSYRTLRQLLLRIPGIEAAAGPHLSLVLREAGATEGAALGEERDPEEILPLVVQELRTFLRESTAAGPLIVQWDDLQWTDPSSLTVLGSILSLAEELPLLFLLLFRPGEERIRHFLQRCHDALPGRCRIITLSRLDHDRTAALLGNLLRGRQVPEDVREKFIGRSDGNPLFLEELVRQSGEHGGTPDAAGGNTRADGGGTSALPDTLRGVIMARIDALPATARRLLQTAAVIGRTFDERLLQEILPREEAEGALAGSLEELVRREFIVRRAFAGEEGDRPAEYLFAHSLTHEVAHESLLLAQRKELHRRTARTIRQSYAGDPAALAEVLSLHYEIAGEKEEAFQALMEAGDRARSMHAHLEAINHYRRALRLASELGIAGAMLRNLHEGLGDAYAIAAKYPAALEQYRLALALPQNTRRKAALFRKQGDALDMSGRCEEAIASFLEGDSLIRSTNDPAEAARIRSGLGRAYLQQGEYRKAIELYSQAEQISREREDQRGIAHACNGLGLAHGRLGDEEKALGYLTRARSIWEERNESHGLSATYNNIGQVALLRGDYHAAAAMFRRSIDCCTQTGNRHGLASACDNLGQALALAGEPEEGTLYIAKAAAIFSDIGAEREELTPELWQRSGIW